MVYREFMQMLADEYIIGISVLIVFVIAIHIFFSVRLIVTSRREGLDVCVSAMIPIYNLVLWVRKSIRKYKNKKIDKIELNQEIEL